MLEVLDALFGDLFDGVLALLALGLAVALVAWPWFLAMGVHDRVGVRAQRWWGVAVAVTGLGLSAGYYAKLPRAYVSDLGWRNRVHEEYLRRSLTDPDWMRRAQLGGIESSIRDALGGYTGPDRWSELSPLLHPNLVVMARVDNWFLVRFHVDIVPLVGENPILGLLKVVGAIIGLPGIAVRWLVYQFAWTPLLHVYWVGCPYLTGALAGVLLAFRRA